MTSPLKLASNRRNALRSTGPRTARGKAVVAGNAVKHGLTSQSVVLPGDNSAAWADFCAQVVRDLGAVGVVQQARAECYALSLWRLRRGAAYEAAQAAARCKLAAVRGKEEKALDDAKKALASLKNWPQQCQKDAALVVQVLDVPHARIDGLDADRFIGLALSALGLDEIDHFSIDLLTAMGFDCAALQSSNQDPYTQPAWETAALRKGLEFLVAQSGLPADKTRALLEEATKLPADYKSRLRRTRRDLQKAEAAVKQKQLACAALHSIPPAEELERLERYESHVAKQGQYALAELLRLKEQESLDPPQRQDFPRPAGSSRPLPLGLIVGA